MLRTSLLLLLYAALASGCVYVFVCVCVYVCVCVCLRACVCVRACA